MSDIRHIFLTPRKLIVTLVGVVMASAVFTVGALPAGAAVGAPSIFSQHYSTTTDGPGYDEVCPGNATAAGANGIAQGLAGSWGGPNNPGYWISASNYTLSGEICNYGYAGYFGGNIANTQVTPDLIDTAGIAPLDNATGMYTFDANCLLYTSDAADE